MDQKKITTVFVSMLFVAAIEAAPEVSNVVMEQDTSSKVVTVTYDLGDEPAIVTLDILTNGVSIGAHNIYCLSGDVNRKVSGGTGKQLKWLPYKSWTGNRVTNGTVQAVVKAWATNSPPDYMVVDLIGTLEPRFYTCEEALPGGISNNYYRTTAMVMRRIPAAGVTWTMGSSGNETGGSGKANREWQHSVTMDHDYYMGIFEMTQGQYYHAMGKKHYKDDGDITQDTFDQEDWELRPLDYVRYTEIRNLDSPYKWISGYANNDYPAPPYSGSIIGGFRAKTGMLFELPSEAEWEYACRAGTGEGFWNDGSRITVSSNCPNLPGRVSYNDGIPVEGDENYGVEDKHSWTSKNGTAIVGSYPANKWGLYDMHGNVSEWCNDFKMENCSSLKEYLSTGKANANGSFYIDGSSASAVERYRVHRGGNWSSNVSTCRSSAREFQTQNPSAGCNIGLRLVCPVGIP